MKSIHFCARSAFGRALQHAHELDLAVALPGRQDVAGWRVGRFRIGEDYLGGRAGGITHYQRAVALGAAAAELVVVCVSQPSATKTSLARRSSPEVEVGVRALLAEDGDGGSRKARPGDEVAGFSTTSRPLYSGLVRSRSSLRQRPACFRKVGLVVVQGDVAIVYRQWPVARVQLELVRNLAAPARRMARRSRGQGTAEEGVVHAVEHVGQGVALAQDGFVQRQAGIAGFQEATLQPQLDSNSAITSSLTLKLSCVITVIVRPPGGCLCCRCGGGRRGGSGSSGERRG